MDHLDGLPLLFVNSVRVSVVMQVKIFRRLVIPKRGLPREESVAPPPANSRFLTDKSGFGMTSGQVYEHFNSFLQSFLDRTSIQLALQRVGELQEQAAVADHSVSGF
jgi:hypothetical protein